MGNRAVIAFSNDMNSTGIYLHWNGGPESVLAFCAAADEMGARQPTSDSTYAMAGLLRAITLFMHDFDSGDLTSVGVGRLGELDCDNYDNGLYIVGDDFEITSRMFTNSRKMKVTDLTADEREKFDAIWSVIKERHEMICGKAAEERKAS